MYRRDSPWVVVAAAWSSPRRFPSLGVANPRNPWWSILHTFPTSFKASFFVHSWCSPPSCCRLVPPRVAAGFAIHSRLNRAHRIAGDGFCVGARRRATDPSVEHREAVAAGDFSPPVRDQTVPRWQFFERRRRPIASSRRVHFLAGPPRYLSSPRSSPPRAWSSHSRLRPVLPSSCRHPPFHCPACFVTKPAASPRARCRPPPLNSST